MEYMTMSAGENEMNIDKQDLDLIRLTSNKDTIGVITMHYDLLFEQKKSCFKHVKRFCDSLTKS